MISYVKGELAAIEEQKAIIDVGGIGYGVFMPHQALAMLPSVGNEVKLYTYLNADIVSQASTAFWIFDKR